MWQIYFIKRNKLRCLIKKKVGYIQWNNFKYFRNSIFIHFANVLSWTASHCYISISKQLIKIPNQVFSWSCQQELVAMAIGRSVAFGREEREKNVLRLGFYYWNISAGLEEHVGWSPRACGPNGDNWKWASVLGITLLSRISFGPVQKSLVKPFQSNSL